MVFLLISPLNRFLSITNATNFTNKGVVITMNLIIRGRNMDLSEANREYALNKIQHTERFFPSKRVKSKADVERLPNSFKVEITIESQGIKFRASDKNENFYAAVDKVIDKLEKQFRKHKTKTLKKKQKTRLHFECCDAIDDSFDLKIVIKDTQIDKDILQTEEGNQEIITIQDKNFLKPMSKEEAVLQLKKSNQDFFVFKCEANVVNILYKRHDNTYGLIRTN